MQWRCFSESGHTEYVKVADKLNTANISLMKTWSRAVGTADCAEGSPSNWTVILSTQQRKCKSALRGTLNVPVMEHSVKHPVYPIKRIWRDLKIAVHKWPPST